MKTEISTNHKTEFILDEDLIYLNHAAVGPWPVRTRTAIENFARENTQSGATFYPEWMKTEAETKSRLKDLINALSTDEIALLKNTSEALSVVAYGLDWQTGDNVVSSNQEFPSNCIVWQSLSSRGVRFIETDLHSAATPEQALMNACDENTRLLTISSVQYASGLRMDLEQLGRFCRDNDILFCIDAIQSIGALRFDVQACHADFVMADAHKWMLAPEGIALFYCRKEIMDRLKLQQYGWHMVQNMGQYDNTEWAVASSARRFECGSPNMLGIHALNASLSLLLETGMEKIESGVLGNAAFLQQKISALGDFEILSPQEPGRYAGIVTFRHKSADQQALFEYLQANKLICAQRGGGIRFSPHYYTSKEVMQRAVEILSKYSA